VWKQITGPFELTLPVFPAGTLVIENIHTKYRPAEYNSQGAIDLAIEMRKECDVADIAHIDVDTYFLAYSEIGSEPAKWNPQTRETADHSLPFLIAAALIDGDITPGSFTAERIADPQLRCLLPLIQVNENPEFTARFPGELRCRITIRLANGNVLVRETSYPYGHAMNPLSDDELNLKFDRLIESLGTDDARICRAIREDAWSFEKFDDIATFTAPMAQLHAD
jgi:2-methylcitrate dehydratase